MNSPIQWKTESGSVSISPEHGRVLGIEISGRQALWQPAASDGGWNLGGERLWIGPEVDWFWQRVGKPDFALYQVPSDLNPDRWTVTRRDADSCRSEIEVSLHCAHRDARVRLGISRTFELIPTSGIESRGGLAFRISTTLKILDGTAGQTVDLWSILQVPFGGSMMIPTVGSPAVRDHFAPCPASEHTSSPGLLELKIGGPAMFKVGLAPHASTGRLAYARAIGSDWLVLERSFPLHPALRYCDSPMDLPDTQGDALQFFNDGGSFGCFGEMEHRSPALVCGEGPQTLTESSITHVQILPEPACIAWKAGFTAR
jgi:hypothetical protein